MKKTKAVASLFFLGALLLAPGPTFAAKGGGGGFAGFTEQLGLLPLDNNNAWDATTGDLNGDGYPDIVVANSTTPPGACGVSLSNGSGSFVDASENFFAEGTENVHVYNIRSGAVEVGYLDSDGGLDLYFAATYGGDSDRLFLNDGTGIFIEATSKLPPTTFGVVGGAALGDINGDGFLDIYKATPDQDKLLIYNQATGNYDDRTDLLPPYPNDWSEDVALGDVDSDGDLDIMVGNWGRQDQLFINRLDEPSADFLDVTATNMPVDVSNKSRDIVLVDIDGDNDLDAVIANYEGINVIYLNDGTGNFLNINRFTNTFAYSHMVRVGDVDKDGDLDLVFSNDGQSNLYLNNGNSHFTDASNSLPQNSLDSMGLILEDMDGDSDLDIVLGNYAGQDSIYYNEKIPTP